MLRKLIRSDTHTVQNECWIILLWEKPVHKDLKEPIFKNILLSVKRYVRQFSKPKNLVNLFFLFRLLVLEHFVSITGNTCDVHGPKRSSFPANQKLSSSFFLPPKSQRTRKLTSLWSIFRFYGLQTWREPYVTIFYEHFFM